MSREAKILVGILIVVVGGMIALFAFSNKAASPASGPKADAGKLVKSDSHKIGTGPVTVVEFGDYQCPACGQAYPITKQLLSEENGKMTLVFRNFPLTQVHKNALTSAYAAEAAAKQNKFWQMHDKLYETQSEWSESSTAPDIFAKYASGLGLNVDQFKQDEASDAVKATVKADMDDGTALSIQGTPTFYVNGQQAADFTHDTLKSMIDAAAKK